MGKREGGIQERRDVCIHIADSQQKLTQQCKATIPQSKKKKLLYGTGQLGKV